MQDGLMTRCTEFMPIDWPGKDQTSRICCLVCIHPVDRLGQVVELSSSELLIGRDSACDLELSDDSVSRRHALLRPTAKGFTVVDLGSKNGTFVNDIRVDEHGLEPSDRLRFGSQIFKYLSPDRFEAAYFENAYRMITTDGLTQAYNRRYFFDMTDRELKRLRRTAKPLSLLMVDIDQFKAINDTYGHLAGDEVLIEVSSRLLNLRGDEVFRVMAETSFPSCCRTPIGRCSTGRGTSAQRGGPIDRSHAAIGGGGDGERRRRMC